MKIMNDFAWDRYRSDDFNDFDNNKVGKWMYFFQKEDLETISDICKLAITKDVVQSCKHNNDTGIKYNPHGNGSSGVACFYLNFDDIDRHRKVIEFFLENNLIRKTKTGKLYNISFKLDSQTRDNQYGDNFNSSIKLSNFIDLETGEWIYDN